MPRPLSKIYRDLESEIADEIAERMVDCALLSREIRPAAEQMLDRIHDELGDVEGLAGSLATATFDRLDRVRIIDDVETRFLP